MQNNHHQHTGFNTDQEIRWCPGCGDYAVLSQVKKVLAQMAVPRENQVFLSGIGCAARMPNYINTYGFRGLLGQAINVGLGLKVCRPELTVWVVMGDGEGFGSATSALLHAARRNVDIKVLFVNNEIQGLSRGQPSPTTREGTLTPINPDGTEDPSWSACHMMIASGATFVARSIDVDVNHLEQVLTRASTHRGFAFVEILQNCKVFNDMVFDHMVDHSSRTEQVLYLEHGKPLLYGPRLRKGLCFEQANLKTLNVSSSDPFPSIHDELDIDSNRAAILASRSNPENPECLGVFRAVENNCHHQNHWMGNPDTQIPADLAGDDCFVVE